MALLNPALRPFWEKRFRNRILYGGRASGKSWDAAGMLIFLANNYGIKALCARQFLNKSGDSIYSLLKNQIYRFGYQDDFDIQATRIICKKTKSEIFFLGLWRNIDEIKSLEGVDICLLEEAHNLSEDQWIILDGTFRKKGFQFWIIFNPRLVTDFVWKRFVTNPPPSTIIRKINYLENPWLDEDYLENVVHAMKNEDINAYNHVFLGEPLANDDEAIIKRNHIMAAIDAHIKLGIDVSGNKRIGFDVADDGEDACATVSAYGVLTTGIELWQAKEDEILKSCTRVYRQALDCGNAEITYDAIGVGASCGGKFNELGYKNHKKFLAGGAVANGDKAIDKFNESRQIKDRIVNKDYYCNIKAQAWWAIAERLRNTYNAVTNGQAFTQDEMIFIDSSLPHLEQLVTELCTPRKSYDNAGRVMVESKKDLKKRGIPSPNCADAFIMAHLGKNLTTRTRGLMTR